MRRRRSEAYDRVPTNLTCLRVAGGNTEESTTDENGCRRRRRRRRVVRRFRGCSYTGHGNRTATGVTVAVAYTHGTRHTSLSLFDIVLTYDDSQFTRRRSVARAPLSYSCESLANRREVFRTFFFLFVYLTRTTERVFHVSTPPDLYDTTRLQPIFRNPSYRPYPVTLA